MEIPRPPPTRTAVFVHGAGGGGWEWAVWQRVFAAAGWDTLAPDLRPAPAGLAATTLGDYAAQVRGWTAAVPRPRVLVGASLGGLLAAMASAAADALVLVNPLPPQGLPDAPPLPAVVPWGLAASLAGTRRALPDADDLAALHAFRRWRDESGRVLAEARAGVVVARPCVPVLVIASDGDDDVPPASSAALAAEWGATLWPVPGSHVGPLLGRQAPALAAAVLPWLNAAVGGAGIQHPLGAPA
ncbi:MAG: alpha/beta fold hydrolase [Rhizobium sp.]|nr:alpha/beta fold hydrolase [Rhizobium sp.]